MLSLQKLQKVSCQPPSLGACKFSSQVATHDQQAGNESDKPVPTIPAATLPPPTSALPTPLSPSRLANIDPGPPPPRYPKLPEPASAPSTAATARTAPLAAANSAPTEPTPSVSGLPSATTGRQAASLLPQPQPTNQSLFSHLPLPTRQTMPLPIAPPSSPASPESNPELSHPPPDVPPPACPNWPARLLCHSAPGRYAAAEGLLGA